MTEKLPVVPEEGSETVTCMFVEVCEKVRFEPGDTVRVVVWGAMLFETLVTVKVAPAVSPETVDMSFPVAVIEVDPAVDGGMSKDLEKAPVESVWTVAMTKPELEDESETVTPGEKPEPLAVTGVPTGPHGDGEQDTLPVTLIVTEGETPAVGDTEEAWIV